MTIALESTSATLLYAARPTLNFVACIDRLAETLLGREPEYFDLRWDNDDVVHFDLDGSRVLIGYCSLGAAYRNIAHDNLIYCAALVIAVGPGPNLSHPPLPGPEVRALCDSIIDMIEQDDTPDLLLWKQVPGVFTAGHFDALIELATNLRKKPTQAQDEADIAIGADDFEALQEAMLAAAPGEPGLTELLRTTAAPHAMPGARAADTSALPPAETAAANDTPDLPAPLDAEMRRIRSALYPEHATRKTDKGPLVKRLTIYTLNCTLMVVALPIGAGLMTYSLLGREDAHVTARVLALTAIGMVIARSLGIYHMPVLA